MPKHMHQGHFDADHLNGDDFVFAAKNMTKTERDALSPDNGWIVYNTTDKQLEVFAEGLWVKIV